MLSTNKGNDFQFQFQLGTTVGAEDYVRVNKDLEKFMLLCKAPATSTGYTTSVRLSTKLMSLPL